MRRFASLLLFCAAFAIDARAQAPCCSITAIDSAAGIVSAKVNANGETFQFRVTDVKLMPSLRLGEVVYANFTTHQVSLDGKTMAGPITNGPQAPAPPPSPRPVVAPPESAPVAGRGVPGTPTRPAVLPASSANLAEPASRRINGTTIRRATGLKAPPVDYIAQQAAHQNAIAAEVIRLEQQAIEAFDKAEAAVGRPPLPETILRRSLPPASAKVFDWTSLGKVTPVRDEGTCGDCWGFATLAALESSVLIRYNIPPRTPEADLSEQYILDNAIFGSCGGGWQGEAATEMMLVGTAKESDVPNIEPDMKKQGPRLVTNNPYRALIWGFVGDGITPSNAQLKEALLVHGPLAVSVLATDNFTDYFNNYQTYVMTHPDGVFRERASAVTPDHVVLLVGWDDNRGAWRIKNSWGTTNTFGGSVTEEGDNGFGWIAYGSDMIGFGAIWVEAWNSLFQLPPEILDWLNKAKKLGQDAEQEERALAEQADRAMAQAQAAANQAKSAADKAAADAAEKARVAAELAQVAAEKQKEIATAANATEKQAKEAAAKAAQDAANAAKADASKAKSAADQAAAQAQDAANSAVKEIAAHFPALPDPRKHLPKFP